MAADEEKLPFPEMAELRITAEFPATSKLMEEAFLLLLDGKLRSHTEVMNFRSRMTAATPAATSAQARTRQGGCQNGCARR